MRRWLLPPTAGDSPWAARELGSGCVSMLTPGQQRGNSQAAIYRHWSTIEDRWPVNQNARLPGFAMPWLNLRRIFKIEGMAGRHDELYKCARFVFGP